MSGEMVERVARAIFKIAPDEAISRPSMLAARAAIAAMDPPTEAMIEAAGTIAPEQTGGPYTADLEAMIRADWTAMLREALK